MVPDGFDSHWSFNTKLGRSLRRNMTTSTMSIKLRGFSCPWVRVVFGFGFKMTFSNGKFSQHESIHIEAISGRNPDSQKSIDFNDIGGYGND